MNLTAPVNKKNSGKVAYLTFDDGPSKHTDQLLEILKRYSVKGTFFVIANRSPYGIRMYKKMMRHGHVIGNHSYSHDYSRIYSSKKLFFADFYRMERLLSRVTGRKPRLFRFPGGSNTTIGYSQGGHKTMQSIKAALRSRNYPYFDWTIDSHDSLRPYLSPRQMIRNVLQESQRQSKCSLLFHDFSDISVKALPAIIQGLKRQGFRFDVLSSHSYNYHLGEGNS
ncbi:polysaccharide deacetylase family protein [Paenibacillus alvei]|uniref:Peptidoglycan/xylan/chitin deacetylase, PgdA/CDA1 family n=1 Tax=Paenibacillus alvei TaxID=44250 RepID=A0A383RDZ2_PAEAL|nr:polysaccharide deacetylase family protein [Paenibacillus alvei]SYX85317.1 Peptidoglycan/xylan/chitin deacetylase, PgdA/CDA1 family [Paenibacillus alvei]